jgi:hypothetical protein
VARWSYVAYGPGLATQQARKLEFYWSGSLEAPERATCTRSRNISTLKRRPVPKSGAGSGHGEIGILVVLRVPPNPISIQPGDTFVETSVAKSTKLGESNQSRIEAAPRRAVRRDGSPHAVSRRLLAHPLFDFRGGRGENCRPLQGE